MNVVSFLSTLYNGGLFRYIFHMVLGLTKTIQRGDLGQYGQHYMIAPMTNEIYKNKISCFQLNGTATAPVGLQKIIPNVVNFTVG